MNSLSIKSPAMQEQSQRKPRADRSRRTRQALMDAARTVFLEHGYVNTEIVHITRAAHRATGTFYVHFANKLELLKAMVDDFREDLETSGLDSPEHPPEALPAVLRSLWNTYQRHAATIRALVEAATLHPEMADLHAQLRARARHDFQSMLHGADERRGGDIRDAAMIAATLEIMVCACLFEWHALRLQPSGYTEARAFDALLEIMKIVIQPPTSPRDCR